MIFAGVCIGTAFVQNFADFVGVRIALGLAEGGVIPGIAYLTTRFYTRSEISFRIGVFLSLGPGLSGAFGGLLAAGFLSAPVSGLHTWQKVSRFYLFPPTRSKLNSRFHSPDLRFRRRYHHVLRSRLPLHSSHLSRIDKMAHRRRTRTCGPPNANRTQLGLYRQDHLQDGNQGSFESLYVGLLFRVSTSSR